MSVQLPKQIQAEVEAAEQMVQAMQQGAEPQVPQPNEPPAPTNPQPSQPQPPEHVAPAPPAEPAPPVTDDAAVWRKRFETLQGKYNAEVPQLHDALRQVQTQLQQVTQQQLELARQPTQTTPPQPLVTPQDEERFGADLLDAVRRVVREESRVVEGRIAHLENLAQQISRKADRVDLVEERVVLTAKQRYDEELLRLVPDWQEVDVSDGWLQNFLPHRVPGTQRTWNDLLQEAHRAMDAKAVAEIFAAYKQTFTPAPQKSQTKSELERQVAPSKSSGTTSASPTPERYSESQYLHWMDPRRVHDTEPAKLQSYRAALEQALAENRIDWTR